MADHFIRYKFINHPDYPAAGVFLDVSLSLLPGYDRALMLKTLKEIVKNMENDKLCIPKDVIKRYGLCCVAECVDTIANTTTLMNVTMQDGSDVEPCKKPDGTLETFEEILERELETAEFKRAVIGLDAETRPDKP